MGPERRRLDLVELRHDRRERQPDVDAAKLGLRGWRKGAEDDAQVARIGRADERDARGPARRQRTQGLVAQAVTYRTEIGEHPAAPVVDEDPAVPPRAAGDAGVEFVEEIGNTGDPRQGPPDEVERESG